MSLDDSDPEADALDADGPDGDSDDPETDGLDADTGDEARADGDAAEAGDDLLLTERDTAEGLLVAVCDADVLGESFADGDLSLTVTEEFYGGDPADPERIAESLARCTTANLVGHRAVALAVDHGFVEENNVLDIDGTRHAQLMWL
jgi:hypothetical protein